jgi:hypothetical protein
MLIDLLQADLWPLDLGPRRFINHGTGFTASVIDQQGMVTPPRHLIPPPVYPGVRVSPFISLTYIPYLYFETAYSLVS